ncbi:MAG: peptidylprolyl isomerase [Desulfobulbaceae bacterium]|nr:peptidylprolyl isomerase [Desulfobulbaceae bacterium]
MNALSIRPLSTIIFFLAVFITFPQPSRAELVDRVVAIINNDIITLSELEKEGKNLFQSILQKTPSNTINKALQNAREELLSSLIDKILVQQRAEKMHITVSDEDIDSAFYKILSRTNLSRTSFLETLSNQGISEEAYRDTLKWSIMRTKLINFEIRSKIVITEERMTDYYTKNYSKASSTDGYHILQMGIRWSEKLSRTKEEARKRAEEIRRKLINGENFKDLAKAHSDLPSAVDGGDIGVFTPEEMATYMKEAVLKLKPGAISTIVETPAESGYQIFMLLSVKDGDMVVQAPYETVKRNILDILQEEEMKKQFDRWVRELREEAYIKKIL